MNADVSEYKKKDFCQAISFKLRCRQCGHSQIAVIDNGLDYNC